VLRTVTFTLLALALIAFASNSLLARFSLGAGEIDAATFTAIRLLAGAVVLGALVRVLGRRVDGAPRRRRPRPIACSPTPCRSRSPTSASARRSAPSCSSAWSS
jgi:hypothetical protein